MAFSTATIYLSNTSSVTLTMSTKDYAGAKQFVENFVQTGGAWDDTGFSFFPAGQILSVTVS